MAPTLLGYLTRQWKINPLNSHQGVPTDNHVPPSPWNLRCVLCQWIEHDYTQLFSTIQLQQKATNKEPYQGWPRGVTSWQLDTTCCRFTMPRQKPLNFQYSRMESMTLLWCLLCNNENESLELSTTASQCSLHALSRPDSWSPFFYFSQTVLISYSCSN